MSEVPLYLVSGFHEEPLQGDHRMQKGESRFPGESERARDRESASKRERERASWREKERERASEREKDPMQKGDKLLY